MRTTVPSIAPGPGRGAIGAVGVGAGLSPSLSSSPQPTTVARRSAATIRPAPENNMRTILPLLVSKEHAAHRGERRGKGDVVPICRFAPSPEVGRPNYRACVPLAEETHPCADARCAMTVATAAKSEKGDVGSICRFGMSWQRVTCELTAVGLAEKIRHADSPPFDFETTAAKSSKHR